MITSAPRDRSDEAVFRATESMSASNTTLAEGEEILGVDFVTKPKNPSLTTPTVWIIPFPSTPGKYPNPGSIFPSSV